VGGTAGATESGLAAKVDRFWRFDEGTTTAAGSVLTDAGPGAAHLTLGRGAAIIPGRSGGALRPAKLDGQPAAWRETLAGAGLPAGDWTLAFWLWLDRAAATEGVVFEAGFGTRDQSELVQRVSVLPRENALVFSAPAVDPGPAAVGRRVEFARPDGPPQGGALLQSATLALPGLPWPRDGWHRVELAHDAAAGQLRLRLDGRLRAVAAFRLEALPPGSGYLALGSDGRGGRALVGALDEVQLSAGADGGEPIAP